MRTVTNVRLFFPAEEHVRGWSTPRARSAGLCKCDTYDKPHGARAQSGVFETAGCSCHTTSMLSCYRGKDCRPRGWYISVVNAALFFTLLTY